MGYGLVGACTRILGLLELATSSLYEDLTIPHGPWHEVFYPDTPLGLMAGRFGVSSCRLLSLGEGVAYCALFAPGLLVG